MTSPVDMINKIEDIINDETKEIIKLLEEKLDESALKIIELIKSSAPRSGKKGALADDFVKEDIGKGHLKTVVIYAKNKGSLTHLLEFGYRHKSGTYVAPKPFIRPSYDYITPKMLEEIRGIISGRTR